MFCGEQEPEKLKKHENALGKNCKNNLKNNKTFALLKKY